jgi:hypothetical protein
MALPLGSHKQAAEIPEHLDENDANYFVPIGDKVKTLIWISIPDREVLGHVLDHFAAIRGLDSRIDNANHEVKDRFRVLSSSGSNGGLHATPNV